MRRHTLRNSSMSSFDRSFANFDRDFDRRWRRMNWGFRLMGVLVALVFVSIIAMSFYIAFGTGETVTITVKDKERVTSSDVDGNVTSQYLVFTTQGEVFKNTDTLLKQKFNSSDLQGHLTEGESYECQVNGWRIHILSDYRNLLSCKQVDR